MPSELAGIPYSPNSALERLTESFAGPHDWLSDQVGMYNPVTGNGIYRTGLNHYLHEAYSYGLIPVAAPFSAAALIETTAGVNSLMYSDEF